MNRMHMHMKRIGAVLVAVGVLVSGTGWAGSVSFYLDQTNEDSLFADGTNYLQVTIDDTTNAGKITFTVNILGTDGTLFSPDDNFGIRDFGFNVVSSPNPLTDGDLNLPSGWVASIGSGTNDGFGKFDVSLSDTPRLDPLIFSIDGDSISEYVALSSGSAGQGNVFFAAHVAGFQDADPGNNSVTSAWFGGSTPVPIPAAVLLLGSGLVGLVGIRRRSANKG